MNDTRTSTAGSSPTTVERRAYSLTELLVCIAVIVVILSIALPALSRTRRAADDVSGLAVIRSLGSALVMYASDYDGLAPFIGTPHHAEATVFYQGWRSRFETRYFRQQHRDWITATEGNYSESTPGLTWDRDLTMSWYVPEPPRSRGAAHATNPIASTNVMMSHTLVARPEYWNGVNLPTDPSLLTPPRLHETRHPSRKGALLDTTRGFFDSNASAPQPWAAVAMLDGSAAAVHWHAHQPEPLIGSRIAHGVIPWHVMATPGGLHGIDN